jgi:predicted nucleic acid-binding protein
MEPTHYLIDSNAVIDYLGGKFPLSGMAFMDKVIDAVPMVSVITKIEILGFNTPDEHCALLTDFMNDATVLELTADAVDKTIILRKVHKTKLPDAIIAATAMTYDPALISRNIRDFTNIVGLQVVNPHAVRAIP